VLLVVICIVIPVLVLAIIAFMRSHYGDELFGLDWPAHELNRDDDYRLIKIRLESPAHGTDSPTKSEPNSSSHRERF
jgi:hypothetical protein